MSSATDLVGLGMPPALAGYEGFTPGTIVTTGTSAATAAAIGATTTFATLTTAGSQTGVKLDANTPLFRPIVITNPTATTGIVYPPTDGTINGGTATTGGQNLAQNKTAIYIRTATVTWVSVLTA